MVKVSTDELFDEPEDIENELSEEDERLFLEASQIGAASEEFDILGHSVKLHTLTISETLKASKVAKPYSETEANWLAMKSAITAAAIDEIDGEQFYTPVSISDPIVPAKFKKLTTTYYSDFVNEVYKAYQKLENEQLSLVTKIKKAQA